MSSATSTQSVARRKPQRVRKPLFSLPPRWSKVVHDLTTNKLRTLLVVLSIAVGVFAVGAVGGARVVIEQQLTEQYRAVKPASATVYVDTPFDDDLVQAIANIRGVAAAGGRRLVTVRIKTGPNSWNTMRIMAIEDWREQKLNIIRPVSGAWPPPEKGLLLERGSLGLANAKQGDIVTVELADGTQKQMPVAGIVYDLNEPPAAFVGQPYGYASLDTMEWLGEARNFTELSFLVADNEYDKEHVEAMAEIVKDKIARSGRGVLFTWMPTPGEHPAQQIINALLFLMGAFGGLALVLSGFLVVNTVAAILTQQVRQIGIMRAIGARRRQLTGMYMMLVVGFGLLSILVGVPLGTAGAYGLSAFLANPLNFDIHQAALPTSVILTQVAVGLLVPLLAAIFPVWKGTRISVREAVSDYGIGLVRERMGWFDRLVQKLSFMSRPILLSLRNTFRRKGRLAMTLVTLTLASAIFVSVMCVQDSMTLTLDDALSYWNYEIQLQLQNPERVVFLQQQINKVPGVKASESWGYSSVQRVHPDGHKTGNIVLFAPPVDTVTIKPKVLRGRWLLPGDDRAIVVNTDVIKNEPDLDVGGVLRLQIGGRESDWTIVGVVQGILGGAYVYTTDQAFGIETGDLGSTVNMFVVTGEKDAPSQRATGDLIKRYLRAAGVKVSYIELIAETRETVMSQFALIAGLLAIMAVIIAVVGGLGLTGTMSINVIERTREIGVMRAIGASTGTLLRIVITEGMLIGLMSWSLGSILAIPISYLLVQAVGSLILGGAVSYIFSIPGMLLWLAIVEVLAIVASILPALSAARLTVRDVLAYN